MRIIKAQKDAEHPYAMVSKVWVNDRELSWKAKGIMVYLISKPDTWKTRRLDLIRNSPEGRWAVDSGLHELEEKGYLVCRKGRDKKGRLLPCDYDIYEIPIQCRFPTVENLHSSKNEISK